MKTSTNRLKGQVGAKTAISLLLFAAIGFLMLDLSWRKWPDLMVDFGRELYVPWQLNEGLF
ncbi:MAG: hypothetical protein A2987_06880 [Omnitrophica bacterium RIFCSPLOWO2_01_FULL_45_10]|nr:MAG: hypothetical protein A2987_06880 [Omnitrophica bacterium RIFCSPLOWO2_01_FULL_45_10]